MSNFICPTCGLNNIDCGKAGYKTDREIKLETALKTIIAYGPACQHDQECPLHNGDGFDQGCAACSVVLATEALKGEETQGGISALAPCKHNKKRPQRGTVSALAPEWNKK